MCVREREREREREYICLYIPCYAYYIHVRKFRHLFTLSVCMYVNVIDV